MKMYLNYYETKVNYEKDNGIILCTKKDNVVAKYSLMKYWKGI